jgi:hypothetical protein
MGGKPMTVLRVLEMEPMTVQVCLLCRLEKGGKPMTVLRVLEMEPMTVQACLLCGMILKVTTMMAHRLVK